MADKQPVPLCSFDIRNEGQGSMQLKFNTGAEVTLTLPEALDMGLKMAAIAWDVIVDRTVKHAAAAAATVPLPSAGDA
jgi:hypothetical protein